MRPTEKKQHGNAVCHLNYYHQRTAVKKKRADRPGRQRAGRERQMSVDKLLCFFKVEGVEVIDVQLSFSRALKHNTAAITDENNMHVQCQT